jgi:hypothetical protein
MTLGLSGVHRRALLLGGAAVAVLAAGAPQAVAAPAQQQVSYLGLTFEVPANWPVIDLTATTCVRFDQHAVYLGTPGAQENCPAQAVGGHTGALLVQPENGPGTPTATDNTVSEQITVTTPAARITATYGTDRATITDALASAGLPAATPLSTTPPPVRPRMATAALPVDATNTSGQGFDACSAPDSPSMTAWMGSSPFTNVGIYIGGGARACAQPSLNAQWVSSAYSEGWRFMPIYVGPQANPSFTLQITDPQADGTQSADDAVTQAQALGFAPGSVLYYNMEDYPAADRGKAMVLESAWTAELHRLGYLSGIYSSENSGITDIVHNVGGVSTPDVVWTAYYNGTASTDDPVLGTNFANHQRVHQYQGATDMTYNNVKINVDSDFSDMTVSGTPIPGPVTSGLVSTTPVRLLDTRTSSPLGQGGVLALQVTGQHGIPSNVTAVVLNVTAVSPSATSYLAVYPDGELQPGVSNLNFNAGQTVPNLVTVPVVDGAVDIFNHIGSVNVLADLFGYYTASGGQTYHQVTPTRLLDTRSGTGAPRAKMADGQTLGLTVTGGSQNIPANVSAVIMNVTVTNPTGTGFLAVFPGNEGFPGVSNINFVPGQTISNLVIVPVSNGSVSFYNKNGTTDVIGDIMGYYTPDTSKQFTAITPARLLDTRNGTGTNGHVGAIGTNGTVKLGIGGVDGIPSNVEAVVLNVTAINPTGSSFLTVYPDGHSLPGVSNINFVAGETIPNLVVVPVTNGSVDFYNHFGNADVTADVAGYYVG